MATRGGISGKAENPDLEKRLLEIEGALANVGTGQGPTDAGGSTRPDLTTPPSVSGFHLVARIPGGFTVNWNRPSNAEISRVSRFEIHVATNLNFTDIRTYFTDRNDTSFLYSDGEPGASFFVRMRANGTSGRPGPFTPTLDTLTGKLTPSIIVPDARYSYAEVTEVLNPEDNILETRWWDGATEERIYVNQLIEVRKAKAFIISCAVDIRKVILDGSGAVISGELLLDGVVHTKMSWSFGLSAPMGWWDKDEKNTITFLAAVEPATPRVYNMSIRMKVAQGALAPPFPPSTYAFVWDHEGDPGTAYMQVCSFTFRLIQLLE